MVFIVGGSGFIGSYLARLLAKTGPVVIYDNLSSGKKSFWETDEHADRITLIEGDAKDKSSLLRAMDLSKPSTCIHLASNPDISAAITDPEIDFREGTLITNNVLECCRLAQVSNLVYASGSGVYGDRGGEVLDESAVDDLKPVSTYGASKLAGEALVAAYAYMFGIRAVSLRFANVVGPNQTHGVCFDFMKKLRSDNSRLQVLGDGNQRKSYIHVEDIARFITNWIYSDIKESYEAFNLATLDTITVTEIANICIEVSGYGKDEVPIHYTGGRCGWKGDVPIVVLDSSKARRSGWYNKFRTDEAILKSCLDMYNRIAGGEFDADF